MKKIQLWQFIDMPTRMELKKEYKLKPSSGIEIVNNKIHKDGIMDGDLGPVPFEVLQEACPVMIKEKVKQEELEEEADRVKKEEQEAKEQEAAREELERVRQEQEELKKKQKEQEEKDKESAKKELNKQASKKQDKGEDKPEEQPKSDVSKYLKK